MRRIGPFPRRNSGRLLLFLARPWLLAGDQDLGGFSMASPFRRRDSPTLAYPEKVRALPGHRRRARTGLDSSGRAEVASFLEGPKKEVSHSTDPWWDRSSRLREGVVHAAPAN